MMYPTTLQWADPLAVASHANAKTLAVLFSGVDAHYTGQYSYVCIGENKKIVGSDLATLKAELNNSKTTLWYENFWIGWLGYGLKNQLETLLEDVAGSIPSADICFINPQTVYRFDHRQKCVECYGEHVLEAYWLLPAKVGISSEIATLNSNMTRDEYMQKVRMLIEEIHAGTLYQANLTRKFFGSFKNAPNGFSLFQKLVRQSPAPYSAYFRMDGLEVISSSPEQFLHIDKSGQIKSRPIKGTAARGKTPAEDEIQKHNLQKSEKDKAENLMIVDLMRHDFSRVCDVGSVDVSAMFELSSHSHVHHLSSTIEGKLHTNTTPLEAVLACFPAGSMTGAPKIKAMQLCSRLEEQARGIYSGALGWFGGDGSAELSVVIRTLILQKNAFEFQVGGGIVSDSTAELEFNETMAKALGIAEMLGISLEQLQKL